MKKALIVMLVLLLTACGGPEAESTELIVFAAASLQETLTEIGGNYEKDHPGVALAVPDGNPKGIESFDQLAGLLESGDVFLAMGSGDVPVGQYTRKIFGHYGLDEKTLAGNGLLTYGSNVKEVAAQVDQGTVDCGVIYATDAFSAGLTVVDTATAEMCGRVVYPAAALNVGRHPGEAKAFLDYLTGGEAGAVFESVGFTPL